MLVFTSIIALSYLQRQGIEHTVRVTGEAYVIEYIAPEELEGFVTYLVSRGLAFSYVPE